MTISTHVPVEEAVQDVLASDGDNVRQAQHCHCLRYKFATEHSVALLLLRADPVQRRGRSSLQHVAGQGGRDSLLLSGHCKSQMARTSAGQGRA
jgi:hypothetical protein